MDRRRIAERLDAILALENRAGTVGARAAIRRETLAQKLTPTVRNQLDPLAHAVVDTTPRLRRKRPEVLNG